VGGMAGSEQRPHYLGLGRANPWHLIALGLDLDLMLMLKAPAKLRDQAPILHIHNTIPPQIWAKKQLIPG
jgi:hypothetical protein